MDAKERRSQLVNKLITTGYPVTGSALAQELCVSRQVIVGDIAILRATGPCHHGWDKLADELAIIIDNGGKVLDVIVEHPIYGELNGIN